MQVRKKNEDFKSENEFLTDCINSVAAFHKRFKYGWPRRDKLAKELDLYHGKLTIGFAELEATKMFQSHRGIKHFLLHYQSISQQNDDFLAPPAINEYGLDDQDEQALLVERIVRRIGVHFNKPVLTLRGHAEHATTRATMRSEGSPLADIFDRAFHSRQGPQPHDVFARSMNGRAATAGNSFPMALGGSMQGKASRSLSKDEQDKDVVPVQGRGVAEVRAALEAKLVELGVSTCGVQLALKALQDIDTSGETGGGADEMGGTAGGVDKAGGTTAWPRAQIEWDDVFDWERAREKVRMPSVAPADGYLEISSPSAIQRVASSKCTSDVVVVDRSGTAPDPRHHDRVQAAPDLREDFPGSEANRGPGDPFAGAYTNTLPSLHSTLPGPGDEAKGNGSVSPLSREGQPEKALDRIRRNEVLLDALYGSGSGRRSSPSTRNSTQAARLSTK